MQIGTSDRRFSESLFSWLPDQRPTAMPPLMQIKIQGDFGTLRVASFYLEHSKEYLIKIICLYSHFCGLLETAENSRNI